MQWFGWVLLVFAVTVILYLWMIAPSLRQPKPNVFPGKLIAHRGLHNAAQQVYENSMKAFSLAIDHGYGIEMDVQFTKDKQLIVHHDSNTARICGVDRVIAQTDYADLPTIPDGSRIPLFSDFLAMVAGRVPLVVEIKGYGDQLETAQATLGFLREYEGPFCVESFAPRIVRYFRQHAPGIIRGQLDSCNPAIAKAHGLKKYIVSKHLLHNFVGRPHFIAYDCKYPASLSLLLDKYLFGARLVAWTVNSQPLLEKTLKRYGTWIFEGFTPKR